MAGFLKRRNEQPIDIELFGHALLHLVDVCSFALTGVLLVVSLYWLILIKLQEDVQLLMLPNSDLEYWQITVILAIVGQSVGLLYMTYQQIK